MALDPRSVHIRFERSVQIVQSLPKSGTIQTSYDDKLQLYSLYKQATEGPVKSQRPGVWDVLGRSKWDAWNKRRNLSKVEAEKGYGDVLVKILNNFKDERQAKIWIKELLSLDEEEEEESDSSLDSQPLPSTSLRRPSAPAPRRPSTTGSGGSSLQPSYRSSNTRPTRPTTLHEEEDLSSSGTSEEETEEDPDPTPRRRPPPQPVQGTGHRSQPSHLTPSGVYSSQSHAYPPSAGSAGVRTPPQSVFSTSTGRRVGMGGPVPLPLSRENLGRLERSGGVVPTPPSVRGTRSEIDSTIVPPPFIAGGRTTGVGVPPGALSGAGVSAVGGTIGVSPHLQATLDHISLSLSRVNQRLEKLEARPIIPQNNNNNGSQNIVSFPIIRRLLFPRGRREGEDVVAAVMDLLRRVTFEGIVLWCMWRFLVWVWRLGRGSGR